MTGAVAFDRKMQTLPTCILVGEILAIPTLLALPFLSGASDWWNSPETRGQENSLMQFIKVTLLGHRT